MEHEFVRISRHQILDFLVGNLLSLRGIEDFVEIVLQVVQAIDALFVIITGQVNQIVQLIPCHLLSRRLDTLADKTFQLRPVQGIHLVSGRFLQELFSVGRQAAVSRTGILVVLRIHRHDNHGSVLTVVRPGRVLQQPGAGSFLEFLQFFLPLLLEKPRIISNDQHPVAGEHGWGPSHADNFVDIRLGTVEFVNVLRLELFPAVLFLQLVHRPVHQEIFLSREHHHVVEHAAPQIFSKLFI